MVVLGAKLSEEPYSREDKELLSSIAGQAGLVLKALTWQRGSRSESMQTAEPSKSLE